MIFKNPYVTAMDKLDSLAHWLIIHSIIYYNLNDSIVTDFVYDANCKQYVELANEVDTDDLIKTRYYYVMYDFDGSTGYHLASRLNYKDSKKFNELAPWVLRRSKEGWK